MNYRIVYSNELYHHGVKGMKWGVRKEYVPKGRKKASGSISPEKKKRKGLTRNQKIALGVAAVAVTGVVLYKTGSFDKIARIGKQAVQAGGTVKGIELESSSAARGYAADLASKINPIDELCGFNSFCAGASNDAIQVSLNQNSAKLYVGNANDLLNKALKDPGERVQTVGQGGFVDKDSLTRAVARSFGLRDPKTGGLKDIAEGARGQITSAVNHSPTDGHAINWRVEGGIMKFFGIHEGHAKMMPDGTVGKVYKPVEDMSHVIGTHMTGERAVITRLDGLTEDDFTDFGRKAFTITRK